MGQMYWMGVEGIRKQFGENGFRLRKGRGKKLIGRSGDVVEKLYKGMWEVVLEEDYVWGEERQDKVVLGKRKGREKGWKKGQLWGVSGGKVGVVLLVYEDG